jgi:hypothetical protein
MDPKIDILTQGTKQNGTNKYLHGSSTSICFPLHPDGHPETRLKVTDLLLSKDIAAAVQARQE